MSAVKISANKMEEDSQRNAWDTRELVKEDNGTKQTKQDDN